MNVQDILQYLKVIRKWWWVTFLLCAFTISTALIISLLSVPKYKATTIIQVNAPPHQEGGLFSQLEHASWLETVEQTQTSFAGFLQAGDAAWRALEALPDIPITSTEVRENLEIETFPDSRLMHISITAPNPAAAALLANTIVEIGLEQYGILLARPAVTTRLFAQQELEVARAELHQAEEALTQFRIEHIIGNLDDTIQTQNTLLRSLRFAADTARAEGDIASTQDYERIIQEREAELQNIIGLSVQYNALVDRVDHARATNNLLHNTLAEAQIKEGQILGLGSVQVITAARPPQNPVSLIGSSIIIFGTVASIMLGILLSLFLEYLEISGALNRPKLDTRQSDMAVFSDNPG